MTDFESLKPEERRDEVLGLMDRPIRLSAEHVLINMIKGSSATRAAIRDYTRNRALKGLWDVTGVPKGIIRRTIATADRENPKVVDTLLIEAESVVGSTDGTPLPLGETALIGVELHNIRGGIGELTSTA